MRNVNEERRVPPCLFFFLFFSLLICFCVTETRFLPQSGGGIRNDGNTCYVNASLQALLALPPFVADVTRLDSAPPGAEV